MRYDLAVRAVPVLLAVASVALPAMPLQAQESPASPGSVIMRSQNVITWWVVDPSSGQAAFYGGDIAQICRDDPDGYDLLDFQEVASPSETARNLLVRGEQVGSSLWEAAPPFNAGLCADVLAREPVAVGESDVTITGRFPTTWADPDVTSPFGLSARGTMRTPGGATMRVNAHYRCVAKGADMECTQGVQVR